MEVLTNDVNLDKSNILSSLQGLLHSKENSESASLINEEPNILGLDKIGVEPKMPPLPLDPKYKKKPSTVTQRKRHFQLTLNDVDRWNELRDYIVNIPSFHYGVASREVAPSTGHVHIHFYVRFDAAITLSFKKLQGAHVEYCKGTIRQNIDYVKKTHDPDKRGEIIFEEGELNDKLNPEKDTPPTIKEVKEMTKEERENLEITYYSQVEKINILKDNEITGKQAPKKVKVIYIWGPSGSGKSLWAQWMFRDTPFDKVKFCDSFWHGVSGVNRACLYDDFRDSHMKPSEFINFIDYSVSIMNVKNGSMKNHYKYIIITSVQDPHKLYWMMSEKDEEPKKQWLRRMKIKYAPDFISEDDINKYLKDLGLLDSEDEDPNDPFKDEDFDL